MHLTLHFNCTSAYESVLQAIIMHISWWQFFFFSFMSGGDQCRGIQIFAWEEPTFHPSPRRTLLQSSSDFCCIGAPRSWAEESRCSCRFVLQDLSDLWSTVSLPGKSNVGRDGHHCFWCQTRSSRVWCSESLQGILPFQPEMKPWNVLFYQQAFWYWNDHLENCH